MKRLIIALLIILITGTGLYSQTAFGRPDTVSRSTGTTVFDTVTMDIGYKTIYVTNGSTGTLTVCFSYFQAAQHKRDTVNFFTVGQGLTRIFPMREAKYMYWKSTIAGTVTAVIDYGIGENSITDIPTDANGNIKAVLQAKIDTLIYKDSLKAGDSTWSIDCRGYDFGILYGIADTSGGTYLDSMDLWLVTAAGNEFKIGVKGLINNTDDSLVLSTVTGKAYMIFSPYIEKLKLRLNNAIYYATRQWKFEFHLYKKR